MSEKKDLLKKFSRIQEHAKHLFFMMDADLSDIDPKALPEGLDDVVNKLYKELDYFIKTKDKDKDE